MSKPMHCKPQKCFVSSNTTCTMFLHLKGQGAGNEWHIQIQNLQNTKSFIFSPTRAYIKTINISFNEIFTDITMLTYNIHIDKYITNNLNTFKKMIRYITYRTFKRYSWLIYYLLNTSNVTGWSITYRKLQTLLVDLLPTEHFKRYWLIYYLPNTSNVTGWSYISSFSIISCLFLNILDFYLIKLKWGFVYFEIWNCPMVKVHAPLCTVLVWLVAQRHFQQYFSCIVAVSWWRKP